MQKFVIATLATAVFGKNILISQKLAQLVVPTPYVPVKQDKEPIPDDDTLYALTL